MHRHVALCGLLLAGCVTRPAPVFVEANLAQTITGSKTEIRRGGSIDIVFNELGQERFRGLKPGIGWLEGEFTIGAEKALEISQKLEEFRQQSAPEGTPRPICRGVYQPHREAILIRWSNELSTKEYWASLGCDSDRYAGRNAKLLSIIDELARPLGF